MIDKEKIKEIIQEVREERNAKHFEQVMWFLAGVGVALIIYLTRNLLLTLLKILLK